MRAPVRVGLVTTSYPRFDGDPAGCFVAEHARYLEDHGHTVDVIAAGDRGDGVNRFDPAASSAGGGDGPDRSTRIPGGALFYRGGGPEALEAGGAAWLDAARFTARLTLAIARRARRWDAAVTHWLVPSALAALAAAPRLPILAIAHSGDVHTLHRIGALGPFAALCAVRPRLRLSFVSRELHDLVLAAAPRRLRARLAGRSQVCPMGIDVGRLRAAPRIASEAPTVLFLGRLVPVKGAIVAAAAAHLWSANARLLVAGAGPDEAALRCLAAAAPPGRVELVGEVRGKERDRLLAMADLVLIPSVHTPAGRTEGMPMAALEAMAAGAAVVASAVGGLADIPVITHVPPGDPGALATAVDRLLASPAARAAQVAAQSRFVSAYDWSWIGPQLDPGSG
jgi:glycosyltransferase involved in cell wall biosynthesis